jgi:3-hydroxybutyryl-CoA dehydrogenase
MSNSASFPPGDPALALLRAQPGIAVVLPGEPLPDAAAHSAILVELQRECLAEHVDETAVNILGFARWRNGDDAPSALVELVAQKGSDPAAIAAATAALEAAGLTVALCDDQPGRILDRLLRPKYNAALRFLDEGLASQADMDLTCRLGLGYPDGPIERLLRGGLHHHHAASAALFEAFGTPGYAPARRSAVAARRRARGA